MVVGLSMLITALAPGSALAAQNNVPEEPTLTVRLVPPRPYLQEEIVQHVRVVARYPFEELILDLPPVPGAEIVTLQQPKNRYFETYGGEGYLYDVSRAIFPKQSGELVIPAVRVSGSVSIGRDQKRAFAVGSEAVTLTIRPPPAAFGDAWWLVGREARIDESWSRSLDKVHAGDRLTRTVTLTVAGATGAHLPELEQDSSTGLTILPGRSERSTEITPAGVIGTIRRSFDLRVDSDQPTIIRPVRVAWWNTSTEIERSAATPVARIEPQPRDVDALVAEQMARSAADRSESRRGLMIIASGGAALAIACACWLIAARRRVKPADRRLRQALAGDGSAVHAVRMLTAWADATFPESAPMTLERLGRKLGPAAQQRIAALQRAAFAKPCALQDPADLALAVLGIAQRHRQQPIADLLARALDRLLGPRKRLPEIEAKRAQNAG
jgi:hypothetical protein